MGWRLGSAVLLVGALARAVSPPFSVSVETSWPAPPLLVEILETAHDEAPESYFPLLRLLTQHAVGGEPTPQAVLEHAMLLMDSHALLAAPGQRSTFNLALGLHTAAPRIEAAYSVYDADEAALGVAECGSWVEWRGKGFCDADELRRVMERGIDEGGHQFVTPKSKPFEHVSPSSNGLGAQAVLYYTPSPDALPLLKFLDEHAKLYPSFQYAVRYKAPISRGDAKTPLAGYGVEMALKKTDYLVVDDRDMGSAQAVFRAAANASRGFPELGEDPWAETATPLTPEETQDLGLAAVALVKSSKNPLNAFVELAQDIPKYSAALARKVQIPAAIRSRAQRIAVRHPIGPGFFMNGRMIKDTDVNAFSLLSSVRRERHVMESLISLGLNPKQAYNLLSDQLVGEAQMDNDPLEGLVDASDRLEGEKTILWLNDLEKDAQYARMPSDLRQFMRPVMPGQLHMVRRNTWNIVLVLDLSTPKAMDAIANQVNALIQRNVPLHFGLVPMFSEKNEPAAQMAKFLYYLRHTFDAMSVRDFAMGMSYNYPNEPGAPKVMDIKVVADVYEDFREAQDVESISFAEIMQLPELDERLEAAKAYMERLGATPTDNAGGHVFMNGKHVPYSPQWTMMLQSTLTSLTATIQEMVAGQILTSPDELATFFYDLPTTSKRRNKFILPTQERELSTFNLLDVFKDEAGLLSKKFIYPADNNAGTPSTIWVVGDLDAVEGRALVEQALEHLTTPDCSSRLGFIHVPTEHTSSPTGPRLSTFLYQMLSGSATLGAEDVKSVLRELDAARDNLVDTGKVEAESEDAEGAEEASEPLNSFTSSGWSVTDVAQAAEFWRLGSTVAQKLKMKSSRPHLLVNGRLIGPLSSGDFTLEDFTTLERYELQKRVYPVISLLKTFYQNLDAFSREDLADLIAASSSIISSSYMSNDGGSIFTTPPGPRGRFWEQLDDGELSFTVGEPETALIHVVAVVDPISEEAQRWSALLKWLSSIDHVAVSVYFDPNIELQEFKVKRFYRSALTTGLSFDVDGQEVAPAPRFNDLPSTPIFTLSIDTPQSWIVRPKESPLDLDNLLIGKLNAPTNVLFHLNQLVIEGHARDAQSQPPRGLQLQLLDGEKVVSDTQVMANLGYFQFKATPGVYQLSIRPGRGREVFDMESAGAQGWDSPPVNVSGPNVMVAAFDGVTLFPRFERQPGMQSADVLEEAPADSGGWLSKVKSLVGMKAETAVASRHADINIFTVASGLLYERFASIMILSVMKHTQSSVKFWFIENFLSPTFIKFLPHLAQEYGFDYELVTYKWPSWLRAQTEKQRIIWAYKILFLDVLFPMDLDKVIFVDADQIVRTDMKELVDLDIQGHVYAYPPMGDDRVEMEGFRFWKTGYWAKELRGKPYHISALYLVDLKRFRQRAAGDRLRGNYQALSADPNSLANLDQDLPNSMQRQIPIFTLDQDWLWCQTWCSDESLQTAKTIDLCQNPLTKEPKLVRARQIPEWDSYDREIAAFAATLSTDGGALAANVDDLAGSPVTPVVEEAQPEVPSVLSDAQTEPDTHHDEL